MSALPIHITPDGEERKLGCVLPETFPTAFPAYGDRLRSEVMTLSEIRSTLAASTRSNGWLYGRRQRFAGRKYIRNQRHFGSCNGWAVAGRLSRMRELRGEPYVCLSGSDAYSQMNGGRDNGSTLEAGMKVIQSGIAPEDLVPWDRIYSHQIGAEAAASRVRFKGVGVFAVDTEEELASAILRGHLCVIAVHASGQYGEMDGDGISRGGNGPGNHSVGCDDVRMLSDGTLVYEQPNSWDITWGDGGSISLTYDRHLRETVKYHRFFALVSTSDDPTDDYTPLPVKD